MLQYHLRYSQQKNLTLQNVSGYPTAALCLCTVNVLYWVYADSGTSQEYALVFYLASAAAAYRKYVARYMHNYLSHNLF